MPYTIAIELIVDQQKVDEENAAVESMVADRSDVTEWKDSVRVSDMRRDLSNAAKKVPLERKRAARAEARATVPRCH